MAFIMAMEFCGAAGIFLLKIKFRKAKNNYKGVLVFTRNKSSFAPFHYSEKCSLSSEQCLDFTPDKMSSYVLAYVCTLVVISITRNPSSG